MDRKIIVIAVISVIILPIFSGCLEEEGSINRRPEVIITYPHNGDRLARYVIISGAASDPNGNKTLKKVEIKINGEWESTDGIFKWGYTWNTYEVDNGYYNIQVRAWDGAFYSDIEEIAVYVYNPKDIETGAHKWAVFVIGSNFPEDNESKLGNGGLYLAENISSYFIENYEYPTSNVIILFDDGWFRYNNGFGERLFTLQERFHRYNITYGAATNEVVVSSLQNIIEEANRYEDSEVFLWFSSHGLGDERKTITGGKILEESAIFLWDDVLSDKELGLILSALRSEKTCIIVDACFSGGFADKSILNFPTFFLIRSGIPSPGRVVISGASKYRSGFASLTRGPLFSLIWFDGIQTGKADGFRSGLLNFGRPTRLDLFKDGSVSVEEAFYYARYLLRSDESLEDYNTMEPQINDQYPDKGILRSRGGLILGEG